MIGIGLGLLTVLLHASTAWRYGYFRDELYFIACSRHPAWGYVDQPPLVAMAAWLASPFGYHLLALRALPLLAASLTVVVSVAIVRDLGGGRFAQALAGIAVALTPAYLLLGNTLTTTSFEGLSWTLAVWCLLHIVRGGGSRWWVALALSFAFGLYGKYSIALLALALLAGLVVTPERRVLRNAWLVVAVVITLVLVSPNIAWQAAHGWPMIAVLQGDAAHRHAFNTGLTLEYQDVARNTVAFAIEQLIYTGPASVPIWIAALVAPFWIRGLRDLQFITVAYAVLFAFAIALEAKGYYIIGIYGSLLAIGAVVLERAVQWLRITALVAVALVGVLTLPLSVPVLSVDGFIAYARALRLTGTNGAPPQLMQPVYAEEFGWERLARDVGRVYASLPPAQRARTAVYADTYADAGAIDLFGPRYGLPPAISSQNTYFLWGTHGYDGSTLIAIGATRIDLLKRYYRHVTLVATSTEPLKAVVEGPSPIYLCTDPVAPLSQIWPNLRWYGA